VFIFCIHESSISGSKKADNNEISNQVQNDQLLTQLQCNQKLIEQSQIITVNSIDIKAGAAYGSLEY
jgi:hypothetical protein